MFRVKIILLSIFISGSVLAGFGLYFLSLINKAGMDRIDREILTLGGSQLHAPPHAPLWRNFGKSLEFVYDEQRLKDLIFQVTGPQKDILYKSSDWPLEISEASFPEFDHEMAPPPGRDGGTEARPGSRIFPRPDDALRPRRNDLPDDNSRAGMPPRFNGRGNQQRLSPPPDDHDRSGQFLPPPADDVFWLPVRIKEACFRTIKTPTGSWRVAIIGNQWVTVLIGMNMAGYYQDKERFQTALLITVPVALLLLAGGGWIVAHRAMRPVALITRTAERINAQALDQRIPRTGADRELSRLVDVINDMLDRLQKSFNQAVRFSADAAHELQSPLTVLQGELDDAVQHAANGSEEQQRCGALLEEVQRLKVIVQKLLVLARADAGRLNLRLEPVDLGAMIENAVEDAEAVAPHLRMDKQIEPNMRVKADPDLLGQLIQNLMSNAVKYNTEAGLIRIRLGTLGRNARLTISNTGSAIPPEERERIFDRFYRVDKSRNRAIPGSGLGLSLSREIAHAHDGSLRLDPPATDGLVSFSLTLPRISS